MTVNSGGQFNIDDNVVGATFNFATGALLTLNGPGKPTSGGLASPIGAFRYQNGGGFSATFTNSVVLASTSTVFINGTSPP